MGSVFYAPSIYNRFDRDRLPFTISTPLAPGDHHPSES